MQNQPSESEHIWINPEARQRSTIVDVKPYEIGILCYASGKATIGKPFPEYEPPPRECPFTGYEPIKESLTDEEKEEKP